MSVVTNVLIVGWSTNSEGCMAAVNQTMSERFRQSYRPLDPEAVGGSKVMELDIWAAAFNHVPLEDILDVFAVQGWDDPESMQILVCEQHQFVFETVRTAAQLRAEALRR